MSSPKRSEALQISLPTACRITCWPLFALTLTLLWGCSDSGRRVLGETCTRDGECASGRCDELVCKSSNPLGPDQPCTNPFECASENCAVIEQEARCGPGTRQLSASCTHDLQCASVRCFAGVCAEENLDGLSPPPSDAGGDLSGDAPSDAGTDGSSVDQGTVDSRTDLGPSDATTDVSASVTFDHAWAHALGGGMREEIWGVAVDGSGNVYVAGYFEGTADLGDGDVVSLGGRDVLLTSFDADGTYRWHRALGGSSSEVAQGVAVDSSGNVYVAGSFSGTADFGGGSIDPVGGGDAFVTSFTSAGAHRWQRGFGGSSSDTAYGVAVDSGGDVYLVGQFYGTADFGGGTVTSAGSSDVFVTRFSTDGVHRWQKALGGTGADSGRGVAVDQGGNIYLTGYFFGTADLGEAGATAVAETDVFLTSFTSAGAHRWQKTMGGAGDDYGRGVAVDKDGNVTITGDFFGAVDFGGGSVNSLGDFDGFATSFTSAGVHRWQKTIGSFYRDYGYGVAVDDAGNVYLTGYFEGTADLGGGNVTSTGGNTIADVYITSFTSTGAHRWQRGLGGIGYDAGQSVAVGANGDLVVGGYLSSTTADLGDGAMTNYSARNAFVTTFRP